MKLHILILTFICISFASFGQSKDKDKKKEKEERIEAMQIGFITDALELTVEESKSFWPVYNAHDIKRTKILEGRTKRDKKVEITSEAEASNFIDEEMRISRALLDLKADYIVDLKTVISDVKIAKLLHAQKRFKKELLNKMKRRQKGERKRKQDRQ